MRRCQPVILSQRVLLRLLHDLGKIRRHLCLDQRNQNLPSGCLVERVCNPIWGGIVDNRTHGIQQHSRTVAPLDRTCMTSPFSRPRIISWRTIAADNSNAAATHEKGPAEGCRTFMENDVRVRGEGGGKTRMSRVYSSNPYAACETGRSRISWQLPQVNTPR